MRMSIVGLVVLGTAVAAHGAFAGDTAANVATPASDEVQFTVRVCEGGAQVHFWFNDEAAARWDRCQRPLADIGLFGATASGTKVEATTGENGIGTLPRVTLAPKEKFKVVIGSESYQSLSLRDLFVGDSSVRSGENMVYVETVPLATEQKH